MKTKKELVSWICQAQNMGYNPPCLITGGGVCHLDQDVSELADNKEYLDEIIYLDKDDEYVEALSSYLDEDELDGMSFVKIVHNPGYNQERFHYIIGIWDL